MWPRRSEILAPHQGREISASRPLKIIAISIIFCGNLHKK
jgi:hypothetical protein